MTQVNLFTKQKENHRHRKQTYDYQRGKRQESDHIGVWDQQILSTMNKKINNKVLYIVQETIFNIL